MVASDRSAPGFLGALWGPSALDTLITADIPAATEFGDSRYGDWVRDNDCFDPRYTRELRAIDGHMATAEEFGRTVARKGVLAAAALLVVLVVLACAGMYAIGSTL